MSHVSHSPSAPFSATDIADVVLSVIFEHDATMIRITPIDSERHQHRIVAFKDAISVVQTVIDSDIGSAVVLRLAVVAGIDPLAPEGKSGACTIRCGNRSAELVVSCRKKSSSLALDVMVVGGDVAGMATLNPILPAMLDPGTTVGPYGVLGVLGAGGMGVVYLVEHRLLRKTFAMKVLRQELYEEDDGAVQRFIREARAAARIRSSSVVDVSDVGSLADGRPYLVMELLSGVTLESLIEQSGAVPPRRAVETMRRVAHALSATHSAGVIHRDLSPANIVIETDGVKLVDFGTALVFEAGEALLSKPSTDVMGTPHYIAPERAWDGSSDVRSDIYALGVMLYELLTGDVPFDGNTVRAILVGHVKHPIPVAHSPYGELPQQARDILSRAMAKRPDDRYQSAEALIADLDELLEQLSDTE